MSKYFKSIIGIIKNYKFYVLTVILYEIIFSVLYNKKYNRFEYLNSNFFSDSIPIPFLFLKKIEIFIIKKNIKQLCDLGSGFGKILYYFGKIKKIKIDGIEVEKKIYDISVSLEDKDIKIYNEDILKFDLKKNSYETFILNDPLKKKDDLSKLILNIKKEYKSIYLIFINIDSSKQNLISDKLNIIDKFIVSKSRNIFFCKLD